MNSSDLKSEVSVPPQVPLTPPAAPLCPPPQNSYPTKAKLSIINNAEIAPRLNTRQSIFETSPFCDTIMSSELKHQSLGVTLHGSRSTCLGTPIDHFRGIKYAKFPRRFACAELIDILPGGNLSCTEFGFEPSMFHVAPPVLILVMQACMPSELYRYRTSIAHTANYRRDCRNDPG